MTRSRLYRDATLAYKYRPNKHGISLFSQQTVKKAKYYADWLATVKYQINFISLLYVLYKEVN